MPFAIYVIDQEFTSKFNDTWSRVEQWFGDFHIFAVPGIRTNGTPAPWREEIEHVVQAFQAEVVSPSIALILGHMPVFSDVLSPLDIIKMEVRVPKAERELAARLGCDGPLVSVAGFHKEGASEIWQLLKEPRHFMRPGVLACIRSVVENGGGPSGRISALKHEVMRPFASVRLRLELDRERGAPGMAPDALENVSTAIADAKTKLEILEAEPRVSDDFRAAVREARSICETDLQLLTSDSANFNRWIDTLNAALDQVRQEAR